MGMLDDIRAKYPAYSDMSDKQLADAIHGKFYADLPREEFDARIGATSSRPANTGDGSEVRAYEPTWRETIGGYISDFFGNSAEGDRLAQGAVGSSGLGHSSIAVTDFTPARIPMFAQEAKRAYDEGRTGDAALAALGATPVPVLNKVVDGAIAVAQPVRQAAAQAGTQITARLPARISGRSADDVADKVIAGRLQRSGQSSATVAEDLDAGQRAARFGSNSQATLPEMLADTSDDMQRLTGSVYRTGGEAGEIVKPALERRQRGPENPYAPRLDDAPQGQIERIVDDFDRALEIKSNKGARATEKDLIAAQKAKADELYTKARENSEDFDLEPVVTSWNFVLQQYPGGEFRKTLKSAVDLFADPVGSFTKFPVNNVRRFDNAKRVLDQMIEKSKETGKATPLTRELTRLKKDLVAKVEEGGKNKFYRQAREEFGTDADDLEALALGKNALKEDSQVSIEDFRAMTPAQKKLFRIGMRDSLRLKYATTKPGDNATLPFQQRRVRELLSEVIPTPKGKNTEFADRAQRFGEVMRREERMNQTRNKVLGNSATAERVADDAEFASDALSRILTSGRSGLNMGLEFVGGQLQKVFGYRRDVAASLARKLTSTDPAERAAVLQAIKAAESPQAFSAFAEGLSKAAPRAPVLGAPTSQDDGADIGGAYGRDQIGGGPEGDTLQSDPRDQIPITADGDEEAARKAQAKMYADNQQRIKDRSLVRYGDQVLIPNNIDDAIEMLISGTAAAGDVLAAFPGVGTIIDDLGSAAGVGLKALRSAPKVPEEIIPGATKEGDAILAARRAKAEEARAAQRATQEQAARAERGASYQAEAAKKGSTGTVPIARGVDAPSAQRDMAALKGGLPEGTSPMAIKGRQGMPTRDEQIDLVEKYIGKGGRLDDIPAGPWGRNPAEDAREAIQRAYSRENPSAKPKDMARVPEAKFPSVSELQKAWVLARDEAKMLREQLQKAPSPAEVSRLRKELKETQQDMIALQAAQMPKHRPYTPKMPTEDEIDEYILRQNTPRIFRRDQ